MPEQPNPLPPAFRSLFVDIVRYLVGHPNARDSVEGMIQWWCRTDSPEPSYSDATEVLRFMTARKWLVARETSDQRLIYSASSDGMLSMQVFLTLHGTDERLAWRWLFRERVLKNE